MSGRNNAAASPTGTPVKPGRGDAKQHQQQRKGPPRFTPRRVVFEGRCNDLKNHIYDLKAVGQSDNYMKTTKEIALYVGRTYTDGSDIKLAVENLLVPALTMPLDPPADATRGELLLWEGKVKTLAKRVYNLESNIKALYSLVWGQCSEALQAKIEAETNFASAKEAQDGIQLLKLIKGVAFNYASQKYMPHAICEAIYNFWQFRQGNLSTSEYYDKFLNHLEVLEHVGANISNHPGLIKAEAHEHPDEVTDEDRKRANDKFIATTFILKSDRNRFLKLIDDMENSNSPGNNNIYPDNLADAFTKLSTWKHSRQAYLPTGGPTISDGVVFNHVGEENVEGTTLANVGAGNKNYSKKSNGNNNPHKGIQCYKCKEYGHYATACPKEYHDEEINKNTEGTSLFISGTTCEASNLLISGIEDGEFDSDESGYLFTQQKTMLDDAGKKAKIPSTWILLDNQSTVDVFSNPDLLQNIRHTDGELTIHCNAGVAKTNMVGDFDRYGTVWFHPEGIANVLSLSKVKQKYRITFDSADGNVFKIHKLNGKTSNFKQSKSGLYYLDTKLSATVLVNTVVDNKLKYTNADYSRAVTARNLQIVIGRPSTREFIRIVENNLLPNCPISKADIIAAEYIFGPDVGSLKGKTIRKVQDKVRPSMIQIPADIMSQYKCVTLCADIMYVNRIPFFLTLSRNIKFSTAEVLTSRSAKQLLNAIRNVTKIYQARGFKVEIIMMDGELESMRGDIAELGISLNTASRGEHVSDIERFIRTVKERCRCIYNTLPFTNIPTRLIIEMIYSSIFWLNSFPKTDGISTSLSPRAIVVGHPVDYSKHCQLEFGTYTQTHEEHDNSMATRTTGAIALRPTGNSQGGYYFFSLSSGRILNRSRWTRLPMPQDVIDRVNFLGRSQRGHLTFTDRHGQEIEFPDDPERDIAEDDESYEPENVEDNGDDDILTYDTNTNVNDLNQIDDVQDPNPFIPTDTIYPNSIPAQIENEHEHQPDTAPYGFDLNLEAPLSVSTISDPSFIDSSIDDSYSSDHRSDVLIDDDLRNDTEAELVDNISEAELETVYDEEDASEFIHDQTEEESQNMIEQNEAINIADNMNARYGDRLHNHNLRPRRAPNYAHLHVCYNKRRKTIKDNKRLDKLVGGLLLTQYSMKKGIKMFGDAGVEAVLKELQQLHIREVIEPVEYSSLTPQERKDALEYLMFLKKKRCGTVKGRGCADGRKQRVWTLKEDASSPTVSIESVFLSCTIDANEGRDVATVDVPGAFMHADMDETVYMKFEATMAELIVKLDPSLYRKFVRDHNGKSILYVKLKKALYGTLRAALLFWRRLSDTLKSWGFTINPYDLCVANKIIDGHQCTILWHVDDLKISHVSSEVVTNIIDLLSKEFGVEAPLTINRGKSHDYLGMNLDYNTPGKVKISMDNYIEDMISDIPNDMIGSAQTPAANHLFETNETSTKLDLNNAVLFHHLTAKLLFLCKRARPDIQTAVAFLTTRVKIPDVDDYKKLARVMKYLQVTKELSLTLEAENLSIIKWWVDASYATHSDMKGHTGGVASLGKGAVYSTSTRQKLVSRSSTESELVGIYDVMPQILWTRHFLEAQGYPVSDNIVYQDNKSTILLAKNGRSSSSKRTRHINIRYFFVQEKISSGDISIQYCPTQSMISDFFTKALQGHQFLRLRAFILNIDPPSEKKQDHRSVLRNINIQNNVSGTSSTSNSIISTDSSVPNNETTQRDPITAILDNKQRIVTWSDVIYKRTYVVR